METIINYLTVTCAVLALSLISCDNNEPPTPIEVIHGDFAGEILNYSTKFSATDTFANAYYYNESDNQFNLIRRDRSLHKEIAIFMKGEPLDQISLPYQVPFVNLQLLDLNNLAFNACQFCAPDSVNYRSHSASITATITEKKDDLIIGTFEGTISTATGKEKAVKNGTFRIKVFRKHF
jgi:hypothetical protein